MSSNIDQRTSTNHEQQGDKMIQPVDVAYSSYMPGNNMQVNTYEAVNSQHYRPNQYLNTQVGYSQANMSGSAPVNDPYAMSGYYQQYVQFPGAMVPGSGAGVWSSNPSGAMSYDGGYANEYMPYGSSAMPGGQYDYSAVSWFPTGLDYSGSAAGAAWAPKQPPSDYNSNGYYENATVMGGGGDVSYAPPTPWTGLDAGNLYSPMTGGEVEPNNGDIRALDQGFKTMFVSGGDNNGDYTSSTRRQGGGASSAAAAAGQKKSWANVASQPARAIKPSLAPPQLSTGRRSMGPGGPQTGGPGKYSAQSAWTPSNGGPNDNGGEDHQGRRETTVAIASKHVTPATGGAQYNPKDFDLTAKLARFFVIKSFSEDDIHRSIKFSIWCSTEYGNKRLDAAWHDREGKGPVYLLFSVNGSGHFCGMAQMTSAVDYHSSSTVWAQDKWKGMFNVRWIYVKDVPNSQLRHIRLENNEGKPVTNSRDTQEVVPEKGRQVLRIMAQYRHTTSIFDDFGHYEKQLEEVAGTTTSTTTPGATTAVNGNGANV